MPQERIRQHSGQPVPRSRLKSRCDWNEHQADRVAERGEWKRQLTEIAGALTDLFRMRTSDLEVKGILAPHSPSNPFELQSIVTDCCWCGTLVCCIPMVHFNRVRCSLLSDLWVVVIADNTQLINLDESATALILRRFSDFCWWNVAAFTDRWSAV